jgi:hypothetical protein
MEHSSPVGQQAPSPEEQPHRDEGGAPAPVNGGSGLPRGEELEPSEVGKRILQPAEGQKWFARIRSQERTGGALAVWAMALFSVMVIALTLPVIAGWRKWWELQGPAASVLPVVVSLVGTIVGFYFGIKAATGNAARTGRGHQGSPTEELD